MADPATSRSSEASSATIDSSGLGLHVDALEFNLRLTATTAAIPLLINVCDMLHSMVRVTCSRLFTKRQFPIFA